MVSLRRRRPLTAAERLRRLKRRQLWARVAPPMRLALGFAFSVAILAFLIRQMDRLGFEQLIAVLPTTPGFWAAIVGAYLTVPLVEWAIFRRFWPLRVADIAVLAKKRVLSEAVLGYSGEAFLYVWARRRFDGAELRHGDRFKRREHFHTLRASPLAAVKDVAITSALAGNLATLLMLALAFYVGGSSLLSAAFAGEAMQQVAWGFTFVIAISCAILLFRGRVLSLVPRDAMFAFVLHGLRLTVAAGLMLLAWWLALPEVALATWVLLGALRMVITRLPFIPNKDLLFAAIGVTLAGPTAPRVAALMAAVGGIILCLHAITYVVAALVRLVSDRRPTPPAAATRAEALR